jgi:hypothetical protein
VFWNICATFLHEEQVAALKIALDAEALLDSAASISLVVFTAETALYMARDKQSIILKYHQYISSLRKASVTRNGWT